MADKALTVRIKLRSDFTANWNAIEDTFVPLEGEVIFYKDGSGAQSGYYRVGDGTTLLKDLEWWYGPHDVYSFGVGTEPGTISVTAPSEPGEIVAPVNVKVNGWDDLGTGAFEDVATPASHDDPDLLVNMSTLNSVIEDLGLGEAAYCDVATTIDEDDPAFDGSKLVPASLVKNIEGGGASFERATTLDQYSPDFNRDGVVDAGTLTDFMTWTLNTEDPEYTGEGFVEAGVIASRIDGVREDMAILENNLNQDISDANDKIDDLYDRLSGLGEAAFCDVATMSDMDKDNPGRDTSRLVPVFMLEEINDTLNERIDGLGDLDALHFKGVYDPNNLDFTPKNADVIMTNDGKEYVYYNNEWHLFGDENAYVVNDQNYQIWKANVDSTISSLQFTQTLEQGTSGYNSDGIVKAGVLKNYIATNYTDSASEKNKIVSMQALTDALGDYGGDQILATAEYDEGTKIGAIQVMNRVHSVDETTDFYVPTSSTLDRSDSHYDSEGFIPAGALSDFTLNSYSSTSDSVEREKYINLAALQDAMSQLSDLVSVNADYSYDNNMQRIATITTKDLSDNTYSDTEIYIPQPWYDNATSGGVNVGTLYFGNDYYEITVPEVSVNADYDQGIQIGSITVGSNTTDLYIPDNGGSNVSVNPTLSAGTKVAEITVNGATSNIYAPDPTTVAVNRIQTSGNKIATITVNGTSYDIYAPTAEEPAVTVEYLSDLTSAVRPESGYDEVVLDAGGAPQ